MEKPRPQDTDSASIRTTLSPLTWKCVAFLLPDYAFSHEILLRTEERTEVFLKMKGTTT